MIIDWSKVHHFVRDEFGYAGEVEPDYRLVMMLDRARTRATQLSGEDIPFVISDGGGIRPLTGDPARDSSSHVTAHAVDLKVPSSRARYYMLEALFAVGFTRIGVYDKHIHVDTSPDHDPYVCWTGVSQ